MNKRRWIHLLLSGLLLTALAACGKGGEGSASSQSGVQPPDEPDVSVIAPIDTPDPQPEPESPYVDPLTGEGREEDVAGGRPFAVMLNNLEKALPQLGVSQADVIYEVVAEGGITRMMAVFQELEDVGELGSVRSARDYYVSLAHGHDAIYVHAGGSPQAYSAFNELNISNIDFVNGPYGNMCWRDPERRKTAGLEHSLLTSGEKILSQLPGKISREHEDGFSVGWTFSEEPPAGGQLAGKLTVPFSKYKTGYFTYDTETKTYLIQQHINGHDRDYVDGNNDERVAVDNVLVLYTDVTNVPGDTAGRKSVRTTGTGAGLLCRDGQLYEITWRRDKESECYTFLGGDGALIPLDVGHSYINIVDSATKVVWE